MLQIDTAPKATDKRHRPAISIFCRFFRLTVAITARRTIPKRQPVTLLTSLSDGTRSGRSGLVRSVIKRGANGGQGIRFHRADSQEDQDAIVAFGVHRQLSVSLASAFSFDYKSKSSVAVSVPVARPQGGKHAPVLESFDDPGLYAFARLGYR